MSIGSLPFSSSSSLVLQNRLRRAGDENVAGSSSQEVSRVDAPASLQKLCLRQVAGLPQLVLQGGAGNACFANFLNNQITQAGIDVLTPEYLRSIPPDRANLLTAVFMNRLSLEQIRTLRPEQISWMAAETFRRLDAEHFLCMTPWQVQAITQAQLRNIPVETVRIIAGEIQEWQETSVFLSSLTPTQLSWLTHEQINVILETLPFAYKSPITSGDFLRLFFRQPPYVISLLLRVLKVLPGL